MLNVPHPDEYQEAERRIRARSWLRRARMVELVYDVPSLLRYDSHELERRDHEICERWYEAHGYS